MSYERLALGFDTIVEKSSNLCRIQRFFASYTLDHDLIARLIFRLLPKQDKYELTMDRTNWKFGYSNINILVIGVVHQGVDFPLLFKIMHKFGNSNTQDRKEILERYDKLFGFQTIEVLVADREFVGYEWLNYLKKDADRIVKLVLMVFIAFIWCYKVGIYLDAYNDKKVRIQREKFLQIWIRIHCKYTAKT